MAQKFNQSKLSSAIFQKRKAGDLTFAACQKEMKGKVTGATLFRIEQASQVPNCETLGYIADWLGLSVASFYNTEKL